MWAGWLLAASALVVIAHRMATRIALNSDAAWPSLLGTELLAGNWLLSGWHLTSYTAWTTEAPLYALFISLIGLSERTLFAVPPILYAAAAVLAAALAAVALPRRGGWLGSSVVLLALAFATPTWAYVALQPAVPHMATAVICLATIALLAAAVRRASRLSHVVLILAAAALLSLGVTADPLALVTTVMPAAGAGLLFVALTGERYRYGLTAIAAVFAGAAGMVAVRVPAHLGGYRSERLGVAMVRPGDLAANLRDFTSNVGLLLGESDHPWGMSYGYLEAGVAIVLAALAVGLVVRRLVTRADCATFYVDVLLAAAIAGDSLAYCLTDRAGGPLTSRYLIPLVLVGFALGGRAINRLDAGYAKAAVTLLAVVMLAVRAASGPLLVTTATPPSSTAPVEAFLYSRHLTDGYSPYWQAMFMTVETGQRIRVRPVTVDGGGHLIPDRYLASDRWFDSLPHRTGGSFVLYRADLNTSESIRSDNFGIDYGAAVATFGLPAERVRIGIFDVLVWSQPVTLAPG